MGSKTERWRIEDHLAFELIGDGAVLLDLRTGAYFTMNEVAARAWDLLSRGTDLPGIVQQLAGIYEVSGEELTKDLAMLLAGLEKKGLASRAP